MKLNQRFAYVNTYERYRDASTNPPEGFVGYRALKSFREEFFQAYDRLSGAEVGTKVVVPFDPQKPEGTLELEMTKNGVELSSGGEEVTHEQLTELFTFNDAFYSATRMVKTRAEGHLKALQQASAAFSTAQSDFGTKTEQVFKLKAEKLNEIINGAEKLIQSGIDVDQNEALKTIAKKLNARLEKTEILDTLKDQVKIEEMKSEISTLEQTIRADLSILNSKDLNIFGIEGLSAAAQAAAAAHDKLDEVTELCRENIDSLGGDTLNINGSRKTPDQIISELETRIDALKKSIDALQKPIDINSDDTATASNDKTKLSLKISGSTYAKAFGAALVTGFAGSAIAYFFNALPLWSGFAAMSAAYIPVIAIGVAVVSLATVEAFKNFYKGGQSEVASVSDGKPVTPIEAGGLKAGPAAATGPEAGTGPAAATGPEAGTGPAAATGAGTPG